MTSKWKSYQVEFERPPVPGAPLGDVYALWRFDDMGSGQRAVVQEHPERSWETKSVTALAVERDMHPVEFKNPEEVLDWLTSVGWHDWHEGWMIRNVLDILV